MLFKALGASAAQSGVSAFHAARRRLPAALLIADEMPSGAPRTGQSACVCMLGWLVSSQTVHDRQARRKANDAGRINSTVPYTVS